MKRFIRKHYRFLKWLKPILLLNYRGRILLAKMNIVWPVADAGESAVTGQSRWCQQVNKAYNVFKRLHDRKFATHIAQMVRAGLDECYFVGFLRMAN